MGVIEVTGDLWTYPADWRCITTNGTVKANGECVMGRGVAAQAKRRWPWFPKVLGKRILADGNRLYVFEELQLITFPVKDAWYQRASLTLIEESARQLAMVGFSGVILLPRPGCGNGGRVWSEVAPILLQHLPPNVRVIDRQVRRG